MNAFITKPYQQEVLNSTRAYFERIHDLHHANLAFYAVTEELWQKGVPYHKLEGFEENMPYFCLRVPTGGGKTFIAAKSISLINAHLLRQEHSVILWLVPSKPIREQTLRALRNKKHPYHVALREAGAVEVFDLEEARYVTRSTLDTHSVIIVATRQAFQIGDTELRKVYEASGALMPHFSGLAQAQRTQLLTEQLEDGRVLVPESFANVLRLRRPFIIVDEAHNSRTELSFETLARFRPSGIMELTATPDTERTPSNVLHSVKAAELKAMEMIKLPILLETIPHWQQCLNVAMDQRSYLDEVARREEAQGADYLRPIVLIQAEKRSKNHETLDAERIYQELIQNLGVLEEEIVIATGETRGLEAIDKDYEGGILSPRCPVKYVITQQALAEGWDCPFAYILVSMADIHSATSVEQLLGRILRQPGASRRESVDLNQSYAFVVSHDFSATAQRLRDRLVEDAGFDAKEVGEFVRARQMEQGRLDLHRYANRIEIRPVEVRLAEQPDLKQLPRDLKQKLEWNPKALTLTITRPVSPAEEVMLRDSVLWEDSKASLVQAAQTSRSGDAVRIFETLSERGELVRVPEIAIYVNGQLQLFDDPEVIDCPWELSSYDAVVTEDELAMLDFKTQVGETGKLDIDDATGQLKQTFLKELQRDLELSYVPDHWDETRLAAWLCRNLKTIQTVTHPAMMVFVSKWLERLLDKDGFDLARANRQKFLLRQLLEFKIKSLIQSAARGACQQFLFGECWEQRVTLSDVYQFTFNPDTYAPNEEHAHPQEFRHHYYPNVAKFDNEEELELARWIEHQAAKGRIKCWIRNLVRKPGCSFYLQTSTDKFYPDFICVLPDDRILVVENKGSDRWDAAAEDRKIGKLWEALSNDKCMFEMVKERNWSRLDQRLGE